MSMENLQTDSLTDYSNNQDKSDLDSSRENDNGCAASLLNGSDDLADLMEHCDNQSIGSNSDIWKGSDSEDENSPSKNDLTKAGKVTEGMPECNNGDIILCDKPTKPNNEIQTEVESNVECVKENGTEGATEVIKSLDTSMPECLENDTQSKVIDTKGVNDQIVISEEADMTVDPEKNQNDRTTLNNETANKEDIGRSTTDETSKIDTVDTDNVNVLNKENGEESKNDKHQHLDGDEDNQIDYEDDDFDPSLLCPEVSMDVDENSVVTNNSSVPNEGESSGLPFEPPCSAFVDEVTGVEIVFNITLEEEELRKQIYGPTNPIQYNKIHCTACNLHLGSALEGQHNRFVHPMLKVLICKDCFTFYTSGDFEKDEDGSELYCRWCGQGGQVLCCSKCEYVFCKKCIRINFGRTKMAEIRDSDCWDCFRCKPTQLIPQRIRCYEFFQYVRREMRNANIHNRPEHWSQDFARCCAMKKRSLPESDDVVKKPKKRKNTQDPDYNPVQDQEVILNPAAIASNTTVINPAKQSLPFQRPSLPPTPQTIQFMPMSNRRDNDIEFIRQIPAPQVAANSIPRPSFRAIFPTAPRLATPPANLVPMKPPQLPPLIPTSTRYLGQLLQQNRPLLNNLNSGMKHEWFEKTVRAAARVNSHLSYTLTQLNKAQSHAGSIEELAVVHNKLQEILSSSINSLIQIRKNLRTEFITGIKTVRLPSKKPDIYNNDDDVILVSAPANMPMPSTSILRQPFPEQVFVINPVRTAAAPVMLKETARTPESSRNLIKVKSVNELQSVPPECITIPDDNDNGKKSESSLDKEVVLDEIDPLAIDEPIKEPITNEKETVELSKIEKDKVKSPEKSPMKKIQRSASSIEDEKMKSVRVWLARVDLLKLQKELSARKN